MEQTVFIVDVYSPYMKNENVRKVFSYNNNLYCIRETTLNWGTPLVELPLDDSTNPSTGFYLYDTFEEANDYVEELIGARL